MNPPRKIKSITFLAMKTRLERKLYGRNGKKTAPGPENRLDEISVKR
jgi:hypothetical protein